MHRRDSSAAQIGQRAAWDMPPTWAQGRSPVKVVGKLLVFPMLELASAYVHFVAQAVLGECCVTFHVHGAACCHIPEAVVNDHVG